jgi:hypothetical protein
MADQNKSTIDTAIRKVHERGLDFKAAQIIGTNFMSHANHLRDSRTCAVIAYLEHRDPSGGRNGVRDWFTFTYKFRARHLLNERRHDTEQAARIHYDQIVDTGELT